MYKAVMFFIYAVIIKDFISGIVFQVCCKLF